jgi:hypothetical protein
MPAMSASGMLRTPWSESQCKHSFPVPSTGTNGSSSILICAVYYYLWAILLPQWRNYSLRQEFVSLDGGAQTLQLRKVPNADIAAWDASHDAAGHLTRSTNSDSDAEKDGAFDQSSAGGDKRVHVVVKDDGSV